MNNGMYLVSETTRPEDVFLVEIVNELPVDGKLLIAQMLPLLRETLNSHQNILIIDNYNAGQVTYSLGIKSQEERKLSVLPAQDTDDFIFSEPLGTECPSQIQISETHSIPLISEENVTLEEISAMVGNPPNPPTRLNDAIIHDEENFSKLAARYGLTEPDYHYKTYFSKGISQEKIADDDLKQTALRITTDHPLRMRIEALQKTIDAIPDDRLAEHKAALNKTLATAREAVNHALTGDAVIQATQQKLKQAYDKAKQKLAALREAIFSPEKNDDSNQLGYGIATIDYHYGMLMNCLRYIVIESAAHLIKIKKSALNDEKWSLALQLIIQNFNSKFGEFVTLTPDLRLAFKPISNHLDKLDYLYKIAEGFRSKSGSTLSERHDTSGCYPIIRKHLKGLAKNAGQLENPFTFMETPWGEDQFNIDNTVLRQELSAINHKATVGECKANFKEALTSLNHPEKHLRLAIEASASAIAQTLEETLADIEEKASPGHCDALLKRASIESRYETFERDLQETLNLPAETTIAGVSDLDDEKAKHRISTALTLIGQSREILLLKAGFIQTNSRGIDIHSDAGARALADYQEQLDEIFNAFTSARQTHIEKLHATLAELSKPAPVSTPDTTNKVITESEPEPAAASETETPNNPINEQTPRPRARSAGNNTPHFTRASNNHINDVLAAKKDSQPSETAQIVQIVAQETFFSPLTRLLQSLKNLTGLSWKKTAICIAAGVLLGAGAGVAAFFLFPTLILPAVVAIGVAATALVIAASVTGLTLYHKNKQHKAAIQAVAAGAGIVLQEATQRPAPQRRASMGNMKGLSFFEPTNNASITPTTNTSSIKRSLSGSLPS